MDQRKYQVAVSVSSTECQLQWEFKKDNKPSCTEAICLGASVKIKIHLTTFLINRVTLRISNVCLVQSTNLQCPFNNIYQYLLGFLNVCAVLKSHNFKGVLLLFLNRTQITLYK